MLWFVHVDCDVPAAALDELRGALADPAVVGGGLRLRFDRRSPGLDWLAWTSNQRARRLGWIPRPRPERIRQRYVAGTRRGRRRAVGR